MELRDGQRWHLPRGKSAADIPAEDKVGDMLQEAVTRAAKKWGPDRLSRTEQDAIDEALKKGEYWLARLEVPLGARQAITARAVPVFHEARSARGGGDLQNRLWPGSTPGQASTPLKDEGPGTA